MKNLLRSLSNAGQYGPNPPASPGELNELKAAGDMSPTECRGGAHKQKDLELGTGRALQRKIQCGISKTNVSQSPHSQKAKIRTDDISFNALCLT